MSQNPSPLSIRVLRRIMRITPFWLLYVLSDVAYVLVYYVVHYRRQIVKRNLATSFPNKTPKELQRIERQFYHWLCDYFVEAVKLLGISKKELQRRFQVNGAELLEEHFAQGRDCAAILGHYCNWEWLSCVGIAFKPERCMGLIYKPLHSQFFDLIFRELRTSQPSSITIPKNDILREIVTLRRQNKRSLLGYIADQGPRMENIHLWLDFLNHDTGVFTGAERIMRKMDNAVFYVKMTRPRRGYYTCTFCLVADHAAQTEEHDITRRFFKLLEGDIKEHPQYYLWTHNRWKRTHEEYNIRYGVQQ